MVSFEALYAFSSPDLDLLEVKRTDVPSDALSNEVFHWLLIHKPTGRIFPLDFEAMEQADQERRKFLEGSLEFSESEGSLKLLGEQRHLLRRDPRVMIQEHQAAIQDHFNRKFAGNATFTLKALRPSDVYYFKSWIMDPEVIRYSLTQFHLMGSYPEVEAWFYRLLIDPKSFCLGLAAPGTGELIGYTGISGLNQVDGHGEYFILIGNKSHWGKGIATQSAKLIQQLAFTQLNLHRLTLTASSRNPGALRAYEKAGFIHEGRLREAFYREHEYSDKIVMGILRSDWAK
jgi:RimJ/RimL family protein N-acetyltransferase